MAAAQGLGWLGETESIPGLWRALDSDDDAEVRLHVAEALARLGDPNVASRIPGVVADISWRVRHGRTSKRLMKYAAQPSLGDTADFWS
jgi:HEAT repeat protein